MRACLDPKDQAPLVIRSPTAEDVSSSILIA
jgi:hypothetical protein